MIPGVSLARGGTQRVTGGQAVVLTLESLGVTTVFGIPSVHNLPIMEALRASKVNLVSTRHEQAAVHAADAYARASGRLGVAVVSTGPGTTNAMTGLLEAASASSPVLLITGQVPSIHYGKNKGALHEANQQLMMLRTVVRKAETARRVEDVSKMMAEVMEEVLSGRQGPGAVEIPIDVQSHEGAVELPIEVRARQMPMRDESVVTAAAGLIDSSLRPLIYAGGGVIASGASTALTKLAELLSAPVLTTVNGRGAIPESHPLALGTIPARFSELQGILNEADLMLAIGTRFQGPATDAWRIRLPERMVHLDIDSQVVDLNYRSTIAVIGDAGETIEQLQDGLEPRSRNDAFASMARSMSNEVKKKMRREIGRDHAQIMDTIRSSLPMSSPIVRDATLPAYLWADRLMPIEVPRTSIRPTTGSIGPGFGFVLGAALGSGERSLLIVGDGGAMSGLGDLATIGQEGAPITICLFNDGGYGVLRAMQKDQYKGEIGVDLKTPDFASYARSVDVQASSVESAEDFAKVFDESLRKVGPYLIEIDSKRLVPLDLSKFV